MKGYIAKMAAISCIIILVLVSAVSAQEFSFDQKEPTFYGYIRNQVSFTEEDLGNVLYLRIKGDWDPTPNLSFRMELFADHRTGNEHPNYLQEKLGVPATVDSSSSPPILQADHLWGMVNLGQLDLQFGKMPIGWGTGYVFNPTAKAHMVSLLDRSAEETPGTLGLLAHYSIGYESAVQGYVAFEDRTHQVSPSAGEWGNIPYGIKIQRVVGAFDLSASWIKEVRLVDDTYYRAHYLGGDFAGAVRDFGVYGEAVVNIPRNAADTSFELSGHRLGDLLEATFGCDYVFLASEVTIRAEYYHQGRGESLKSRYDFIRALLEGQSLQARDYLVVQLEKSFHSYGKATVAALTNLNDRSTLLLPEITYDAAADLEVSVGAVLPVGTEGSEFQGTWMLWGQEVEVIRPTLYISGKLSF